MDGTKQSQIIMSTNPNESTGQQQGGDPFLTAEGRNWPEDYMDENGNYINRCFYCEKHFRGHKYRRICKLCDAGSIEYWTKLSQTKKPEDNKCAHAGCWSQGEMTGFARCMVKEVFPLRKQLESLSRWREIAVDGLPKEGERVLWLNHHGRIFHNSWERFTNQDDEWARRNFTHWRPIDLPTS